MAYNTNVKRITVAAYLTVFAIASSVLIAEARPVYARKENQACGYCHTSARGGDRGFRGMFYGANGLNFDGYDEKREALLAGLSPNLEGKGTIPAISYNGNIAGPATQQIQVASLRGPVILMFLDKADDQSKAAVKAIAGLAKAYGTRVTVLGIAKTDDPLKLTDDLGGLLRVYPDPESSALKKFSAVQALDFAVVAKLGEPVKTFTGFSRSNLEEAMKLIATSQSIAAPAFDLSTVNEKVVRGGKL